MRPMLYKTIKNSLEIYEKKTLTCKNKKWRYKQKNAFIVKNAK